MSMFENDQFRWRETYFVLFEAAKQPTLQRVLKTLAALGDHLTLFNANADSEGRFESVTVLAPDAGAAMDICFIDGD